MYPGIKTIKVSLKAPKLHIKEWINKDKQQGKYQPVLDDLTCASGIIRAGRPGTLWG